VNLPNCTSLSKGAFQSCSYLQTATLPNCTHLGNLSINEGNNWVFKSCSRLTSVSVPACIEIGADGFMGCSLLPSIDLPCCLRMDANAFRSCYALSQVSLPVCTDIGGGVFYSCGSLSQVSLPRWLNNSGNSVFQGCTLLNSLTLCTDVYWTIPYQNRMLSNTPIMSGTGSIYVRSDTYSFWIASTGWSSLADRFVSIECSSPALSYSDGLLYGETPLLNSGFASYLGISNNSVTRVELSKCVNLYDNALSGCTAMSKVSLPVCSYVGHLAFYVYQGVHCDFILGYSGVVATNGQLFDGNQDISIYVPASLVDAYKVAPVWSNRSAYIFPISE